MIKELWKDANIMGKITIIFVLLMIIAAHILSIYILMLPFEMVLALEIITKILALILFALVIIGDTILVMTLF